MTRMRSAAQRAPQTIEAATALLARFAEADAQLAAVEAQRQESLAGVNAAADAVAVPLIAELKDIAKQLKPWWEGSFDELTGGKRKSIELGGCSVGYRLSPPKVSYAHGKDEDAVTALQGAGYDALVRVKPSLDKPAVLKALDGEDANKLLALGFSAPQTESFFVERIVTGAGATIAR